MPSLIVIYYCCSSGRVNSLVHTMGGEWRLWWVREYVWSCWRIFFWTSCWRNWVLRYVLRGSRVTVKKEGAGGTQSCREWRVGPTHSGSSGISQEPSQQPSSRAPTFCDRNPIHLPRAVFRPWKVYCICFGFIWQILIRFKTFVSQSITKLYN
jgi:hypothetical protein